MKLCHRVALMALSLGLGLQGACDDSATLGAVGYPTDDLPVEEANLELSTEELNFGMVCPEAEASLILTLENSGNAPTAEITGEITDGSSHDFSSLALSIPSLEPGETHDVEVLYAPTGDNNDLGTWLMTHGEQSWEIALAGVEGGPELQVVPAEPDFGPVPVGTTSDITVVLTSTGETSLSIGQVDILPPEDESADLEVPGWFHWVLPPSFPQVLEPTDSISLVLRLAPEAYTPPQEGPRAFLGVQSTDCIAVTTQIPVLAWPGGSDDLCPGDPLVIDVL